MVQSGRAEGRASRLSSYEPVNTLATTASSAGSTGTNEQNLSAAFSSIASAVKSVADGTAAVAEIDFTDSDSLDVINAAAQTELATLGGLEAVDLTSDLADAKTAITVIATAIDAVADFEDLRNDADGVLATANHLAKAGSFGALDTATFNSTKAAAVANNAPTDIDTQILPLHPRLVMMASFHPV